MLAIIGCLETNAEPHGVPDSYERVLDIRWFDYVGMVQNRARHKSGRHPAPDGEFGGA
jgi:hypothetical protein